MITYLTIITTVLVLTQIIRITQNYISLKKQLDRMDALEVKKEDFENQKKFYRLAVERLEREKEGEEICLKVEE